ncbi:DEAD/DEAH box helicase, partial [Acidovorax sp. HMWF029]
IDVPTITHVFNFGLPMKAEDYTHRIGRTGRAGRDGLAVTFAEFRDRRKIYDIESYSRQQFKAEVVPGMEPTQRAPQAPRGGDFGGRGRSGGYDRDSRDRKFGGPARGGHDRGGFGGGFGGGFAGRGDNRGAPARGDGGGFGGRDDRGADRGFAPRRDGEGYGRKPGFGDAGRGGFAPRSDAGAPRGDFAPRKPAFSKPAGGGGKPFVAHDARKRPARPAR